MSDSSCATSYIQINIFGRKLHQLQQNGIDIDHYLREIGCDKFWMSDVPLFNSEISHTSSPLVEEDSHTSATLVEEDFVDERPQMYNRTTQQLADTELGSFLTTEEKYPRCSTPIFLETGPSFAHLISQQISNIVPVDSADVSASNLKIRAKFEMDTPVLNEQIDEQQKSEYPASLIRSKTEHLTTETRITLKKINSMPAKISDIANKLLERQIFLQQSIQFPNNIGSSSIPLAPEAVYVELKPISHIASEVSSGKDEFPPDDNSFFSANSNYAEHDQGLYDDVDTLELNDFVHANHESYRMNHDENDFGMNGTAIRRSIENSLLDERGLSVEKQEESFNISQLQTKKDINQVFVIKCNFEKCGKSYRWRRKYGKARLIDHALTHIFDQEFRCIECGFRCKTVRRMRYHERRCHKNAEVAGIQLKSLMQSTNQYAEFLGVWKNCFQNSLSAPGIGDFEPFLRQDKNIKREKRYRSRENVNAPDDHLPR